MKLPFAVYTAREGYQWISGLDAGLPRLEQFRRAIGKLPEFDFGDPLSCGAVNLGDTVVVYRFMKEEKGDFRGRDSLYLALTWFDKSVAGSINFKDLLDHAVFVSPMREPPLSLEYDGGSSTDSGSVSDVLVNQIGLDAVGMLFARLDGENLKVIKVEGEQSCTARYLQSVTEAEPCERDEVIAEVAMIPESEPCNTGHERSRIVVILILLLLVFILFGCYILCRRAMTDGDGESSRGDNGKPVTSLTEGEGLGNE